MVIYLLSTSKLLKLMASLTQTTANGAIQYVGLLAAKGLFYVLFGLAIWLVAPDDRSSLFWLFPLLLALSGVCSIGFGMANQRAEQNSRWFVVSGVIDLVFSGYMFFAVGGSGMTTRFLDVLAFWAIQFGIFQGVQAMYPFQGAPSDPAFRGPVVRLHLVSALVAVGLFGVLQFVAADQGSALGWSAVLIIVLGGLLLLISPRLRKR